MNTRKSDSIAKLMPALVKARSEMAGGVAKGGNNTHFRYRYATLEDYHKAIGDTLQANGLHVFDSIVGTEYAEAGNEWAARVTIECTIVHTSGEWLTITAAGEGRDRSDKAVFKATTGARKYAIAMLLRLSTTDDPENDGNGNGNNQAGTNGTAKPPRVPAAEVAKLQDMRRKVVAQVGRILGFDGEWSVDPTKLREARTWLKDHEGIETTQTLQRPALEELIGRLSEQEANA